MDTAFNKRIYDLPGFSRDVQAAVGQLANLRAARRSGQIDTAFAERIMLAVTGVNGCRYCNYAHSRMALRAGLTSGEINRLTSGAFDTAPQDQITALLFAQHYAESKGQPEADAWQRLVATYGQGTAHGIMAYITMITLANLWGNTFDALLSRARGHAAAGSSPWQEIGVLLGGFVIIPAAIVKSWFSKRPV